MKTHEIWARRNRTSAANEAAGTRCKREAVTSDVIPLRRWVFDSPRRILAFFKRRKITVTSRTALKYDKEHGLHHRHGALSKQDIRDGGATITLTLHGDTFPDPLTRKMKRQIIKGLRVKRDWWALLFNWPLRKGAWWR